MPNRYVISVILLVVRLLPFCPVLEPNWVLSPTCLVSCRNQETPERTLVVPCNSRFCEYRRKRCRWWVYSWHSCWAPRKISQRPPMHGTTIFPLQLGMHNGTNGVPGFEGRANTHRIWSCNTQVMSHWAKASPARSDWFWVGGLCHKRKHTSYWQELQLPSCSTIMRNDQASKHSTGTEWWRNGVGKIKSKLLLFYFCPDSCLCSVILSLLLSETVQARLHSRAFKCSSTH